MHFNRLSRELANNVRNITKVSKSDIYYAFILRAISLLEERGELIYIVPYHFFYNTHAKIVRESFIKSDEIEIVIDLDETKIFKNKNPEIVIFKFRKGKCNLTKRKIKLLKIKTRKATVDDIYKNSIDALINKTSNNLFYYREINHYKSSESWSSSFFDTPDFPSIKLKQIAKVGVGLISGFLNL